MSTVYNVNTESKWFQIVVLIISALVAIFTGFNVYYYNQIRLAENCTCSNVTVEQATTMFWINLILVILAIIIFLWSIWRIVFDVSTRTDITQKIKTELNKPTGIVTLKRTKTATIAAPPVSTGAPVSTTVTTTSTVPTAIPQPMPLQATTVLPTATIPPTGGKHSTVSISQGIFREQKS